MFGLSTKERLVAAIKAICEKQSVVYEKEIISVLPQLEKLTSEEDIQEIMVPARSAYFNACFDMLSDTLETISPVIFSKMRLCMLEPSISGVPENFSVEYLCKYGISAGVAFAFAFYAIKGKPINLLKDAKTLSFLNHYQNDIMNTILYKIDQLQK